MARLVLDNGKGVESGLLGGLGLDLVNQGAEVRDVLLLGGPLVLGEELVGEGELGGAADAVDAVVGLLGGQALEGGEDGLVLLGDEIVGAVVGGDWLVIGWCRVIWYGDRLVLLGDEKRKVGRAIEVEPGRGGTYGWR